MRIQFEPLLAVVDEIAVLLGLIILALFILTFVGIINLLTAVILGIVASLILLALAILIIRPQMKKPKMGPEAIIGKIGEVREVKSRGEIVVLIDGEYWLGKTSDTVTKGDKVVVIDVKGLMLKVKKQSE